MEIGLYFFHMEGAAAFLARVDGAPAAGGALDHSSDGLATLFADATLKQVPRARTAVRADIGPHRRSGGASGRIWQRLRPSRAASSHRNYERCGFRVAYTKMNMQRS